MSTSKNPLNDMNFDDRLLSREFIDDPYPVLHELRAHAPVHHSRSLNAWIVSPFETVSGVLRNYQTFSNKAMMSSILSVASPEVERRAQPMAEFVNGNMVMMQDPPRHNRLRKVVMRAFNRPAIEKFRQSVTATTQDILDRAEAQGAMDVIADLAQPLPRATLTDFLGVNREWAEQFAAWADDFLQIIINPSIDLTATERSLVAFEAIREYITQEIRRRRVTSRTSEQDVIDIVTAAHNAGEFTWDEVLATCIQFIFAGSDTTTNMIGNAVQVILDHPEQQAILVDQPDLTASTLEEALRFESPARFTVRSTTSATAVNDCTIPADQTVLVGIAAANRDPAAFVNPESFDIHRRKKSHLAFALGPHICPGERLARLQGQIALGELFSRFPSLRKTGAEAHWHASFLERRLDELKVSW